MANLNNSKIDRYKLETSFGNGTVTHTTYRTDVAAQERRAQVQTTWTDKRSLGSGGFGVVLLQQADGGELRAVKKIYTGAAQIDFTREITVMAKVSHRQDLFVKFLGWYTNSDFVFIAMEYIEHGDLTHYLKNSGPCSVKNAQGITRQLLEGLVTLHELDIAHRDIKPQNVLIASPEPIWVKIADFGVSKRTKGTMLHTRLGSQGYVAPELMGLLPRQYMSDNYSQAVDMWALGCVVHELLTGEIPFREIEYEPDGTTEFDVGSEMGSRTDIGTLKLFCDGKTDLPTDQLRRSLVSNVGIEFVKELLVADPESRAVAKAALASAWLVSEEETGTNIGIEDTRITISKQTFGATTSCTGCGIDLSINNSKQAIGTTTSTTSSGIYIPKPAETRAPPPTKEKQARSSAGSMM